MGVGETTSRTPIDLLNLPLPFTQRPILEPDDFIKECGRRGIDLTLALLEDLHRHRILEPFYRVSVGQSKPKSVVDVSESLIPDLGNSGLMTRLVIPAREGRVSDPAQERFRRWPRNDSRDLEPRSRQTGYWYSYHQILTAIRAKRLIDDRRILFRHRRGSETPSTAHRLNPECLPTAQDQEQAQSLRSIAVLLSALDTRYWPDIHRQAAWYEHWLKFENTFDPSEILSWLRSEADTLSACAMSLRASAGFVDGSGEFYDLIRRANPDRWDSLSGDILIALDLRIAAEVIDRFVDQLDSRTPPDLSQIQLSHQRLSDRGQVLDETLTRMGLSPHPSLVVAVEGETEYLIVPKVFEAIGVRMDPSWIRIENFHGADRDLTLLAQYAGSLSIGQDRGPYVTLARPVTRLVVCVDREKKYASAISRRKQKALLLRTMVESVPTHYRGGLYAPKLRLLTIHTWGKYPFEFAHFTDAELASAIVALRPGNYPLSEPQLTAELRVERGKHVNSAKGNGPNVDRFLRMSENRDIGKPELADALWRVLEAKIKSALATGFRKPPVMKAAEDAVRLATLSGRSHMALAKSP
jgi:hypothetical protein